MKALGAIAVIIVISIIGWAGYCTAQEPLEGWTDPVPVTELNDIGDELYPYLSADGQVMIFSAMGTITMSHWTGSSWGPREYLPSPINYIGLQRMAAITPDLQWIYWVSWRPGGMGAWDIWRSQLDDSTNTWGDAELLGPDINSVDYELGMCFSADGARIYFVTNTPFKNGQYSEGEADIWYSDWDSISGDWGPPINIGYPINIHENEDFPYISASGDYLFFTSWGSHLLPGWQGLQDIFMAIWNGSEWNTMNMGSPINSPAHELGASISSDLTKFYFCRLIENAPSPNYDIMVSTREPSGLNSELTISQKEDIEITAFPNPSNSNIMIVYPASNLGPQPPQVSLVLYDILGREVRTLVDERKAAGTYRVTWDGLDDQGRAVSSGTYIARLSLRGYASGDFMVKITLIR